jgi:hypothetical protein
MQALSGAALFHLVFFIFRSISQGVIDAVSCMIVHAQISSRKFAGDQNEMWSAEYDDVANDRGVYRCCCDLFTGAA